MKKITFFAVAAATLLAASCAKEDGSGVTYNPVPVGESRFAIVTKTVSASTGDSAMVIQTEESLDSGTSTVIGNGSDLGSKSPSQWTASADGRYIYSVQDAGGELVAEVVQYYLDNNTGLVKINREYNASAYHIWGMWGSDFATARNTSFTADGIEDPSNATTYYAPCVSAVYYSESGSSAYGDPFASDNYIGKNYTGDLKLSNGETANIVGFVTSGDYVYASYATSGVSRYAILNGTNSGWDGTYDDYVTKGEGTYTCAYSTDVVIDENTTAFTSVSNSWNSGTSYNETIPFPLTPGNAYIARYSVSGGLESTPEIIATDEMAQAYGRQTGNPYNMLVANSDDDYVYVFSPGVTRRYSESEASKSTDGTVDEVTQYEYDGVSGIAGTTTQIADLKVATTNKGAKVMRIKSGATEFDSSFGAKDIDINIDGKEYVFSRVWHISGSKYLLRVIHTPGVFYLMHHNYRDPGDAYFFIYDTATGSATQVAGLPDPELFVLQTQSSIGEPFIDGNMVYIPMAPSNESYPAIWNFDASEATPTATKGLTIKCSYIVSISKLTAQ